MSDPFLCVETPSCSGLGAPRLCYAPMLDLCLPHLAPGACGVSWRTPLQLVCWDMDWERDRGNGEMEPDSSAGASASVWPLHPKPVCVCPLHPKPVCIQPGCVGCLGWCEGLSVPQTRTNPALVPLWEPSGCPEQCDQQLSPREVGLVPHRPSSLAEITPN